MSIRMINRMADLGKDELSFFSEQMRNSAYHIASQPASGNYRPEGMLDCFLHRSTYQQLLSDPGAGFHFFLIVYSDARAQKTGIPIGVFGHSPMYKLRFPLLLNSFWRGFIMINRLRFGQYVKEEEGSEGYAAILKLREIFIRRIFSHYSQLGGGYQSVMAWPIRGEKSLTRQIAEGLGFSRCEHADTETEYYTTGDFKGELFPYLLQSTDKWNDAAEASQAEISKLSLFCHSLIELVTGRGRKQLRLFYRSLTHCDMQALPA